MSKILQENILRNNILDQPYDPLTGIGSMIPRQLLALKDIEDKLYLPVPMMNIPWVQRLAELGSMADFIKKEAMNHPPIAFSPEPFDTLEKIIFDTRLDNDFEFWAATCAYIKPKKGGNFIPFTLNYPQRLLWKEIEELMSAMLPLFFVLLKSRQFGGSTLIDILSGFIQIRVKENWNSLIAAHINQGATNIRSMTTNLFRYYPKSIDDISLKPFEGTHNIKIIPERSNKITIGSMETPDSIRTDDIKIAHVSEFGLMKKTQGKTPEDLLQSILGTMPLDEPYSMFAIESTAKGVGNAFHRVWQEAVRGDSGMKAIFIPWLKDGKNRSQFVDDAERLEFYKSFDNYENFLWQKGATLEGIKFYRKQLNLYHRDKWRMQSEFPTTCIAKGTLIGTNRGIIEIQDCIVGDILNTGTISNIVNNGTKTVYKLKTKWGYELKCTEDHLIKTYHLDGEYKWKRLDDLIGEDLIILSPPNFSDSEYVFKWKTDIVEHSIKITPEFARFIGIFMGDGAYHAQHISIACDAKDTDFIKDTQLLIDKLFNVKTNTRITGKNNGCCEIRVSKKALTDSFVRLGIVDKYVTCDSGFKKRVCVPECILKSPKHIIKEFIKGIFETDGFNGYSVPKVSLFSMHVNFLKSVQLLLLGFGISSKLDSRTAINGDKRRYTANTLTLQGEQADLYRSEIGFLSSRKQNRFSSWTVKGNYKRTKNLLLDKIYSIEYETETPVYDITIENSHEFDANGILVHNCDEAFQSTGNRFFPPEYVLAMRKDNKQPIFKGEIIGDSMMGKRCLENMRFEENERGNLWIWEYPDENNQYDFRYVVSMDVGGTTDKADNSIIRAFDRLPLLSGGRLKPILSWKGHIDQDLLAWKGVQISAICDNALFVPEDNSLEKEEDGEHFQTILNQIVDDYRNIYIRNDEEKVGDDFVPKYGWFTGKKSKGLAIDTLKSLARERMNEDMGKDADGYSIQEPDERVCSEMDCFEIKQSGKVGAVDGEHDDFCMSTAIGSHVAIYKMPLPRLRVQEQYRRVVKKRSESSF